ncbi:MAG: lipid kinase YegS [Pirellulales bacterium]|nr:lipid kinase YegS [Pirellulales bacterium]
MTHTQRGKRRLRIVLNGRRAQDESLREAVRQIRERGHVVEVRATWEAGQAAQFAEEGARDGVDIVVAAGGDGTINEVVTGLLRAGDQIETCLAVAPLGTANDFATGCGVPRDALAALLLAVEADPRAIDVGMVNERPFVNVATAGIGAEITAQTPPGIKRVLGGAAYSLVGLFKAMTLTPHTASIHAEAQIFEGSMALLAIGNGRLAGGGYRVAPRALLDDGLLDLVIGPEVKLAEGGAVLNEMRNLETEDPQQMVYRQLPSFEIHATDEMPMNLDGEPLREREFRVSMLPRRVRCCLPDDAPLLSQEALSRLDQT